MKLNKDDSIKGLQGRKETNAIRINIETMNKRISCEESGKPLEKQIAIFFLVKVLPWAIC